MQERLEGEMSEDLQLQEYWTSFELGVEGAYYTKYIDKLRLNGQIGNVPWDPSLEVHTSWDIGVRDMTSIIFFQFLGREVRIIDYYENSGEGLEHYADYLKSKPYKYGSDFVPHDAKVPELGTKRTRVETLQMMGRTPKLVPLHKVDDGINAVHETLPRCWFDAERTMDGLDCLRQYRREYDENLLDFKSVPLHDWTSHAADAFRYLAMAWKEMRAEKPVEKPSHLVYEADENGIIRPNMSVREIIELNRRKKMARLNG